MSAWLRCRLDTGMFSDEVAVTYPPEDGCWQKSVSAPESCVRRKEDRRGGVKMHIAISEGPQFAVLPSPQLDI